MNDYLYNNFIGPVIQTLYIEVMIIGMFIVGFSYVRLASENLSNLKTGDFWRRILLLSAVMFFCIYIVLSYNVEIIKNEMVSYGTSTIRPQIFFLLMSPLELTMVGIGGTMFLILSRDVTGIIKLPGSTRKLRFELIMLFSATAAWHFCCILWWLLWIGNDRFNNFSLWFHTIAGLVHITSMFTWRFMSSKPIYIKRQNIYDWVGTIWYFSIVFIVFLIRMTWYANYAMENAEIAN